MRWIAPDGAFYGFLNIAGMTDSLGFAQDLVRRKRVGVAPGSAFGAPDDTNSDAHIRICLAQDPARLAEGLRRIGEMLG